MDARPVLLALTVAATVWNPSPAAGQSWSSNPLPPPPSSYDRYNQPVAPSAPSITERTQSAFSETGAAVRDGVEAGIVAAQQGFNNATAPAPTSNPFTVPANPNTTTNAARGAVSSPWTNTTTGSAAAAPAWPTTPTNANPATASRTAPVTVTPIDGGWSSIGTAVAAPPLLIPESRPAMTGFNNATTSTGRSAPTSPSMASNNTQPLHSVLADPSRPPTTTTTNSPPTTDNWATGWSDTLPNTAATIGRGTAASPAAATTSTNTNPVGTQNNNGWPDPNNWSLPSQPALDSANGATAANHPVANGVPNNTLATGLNQPTSQGQFASQNGFPSMGGQAGIVNTSATNPNMNASQAGGSLPPIGRGQTLATGPAEPQPWMPLIASVLTLAGSLAANLYLGVSYLDARQKYQSLVRKTADTFRRVKAAAA